jgi:MFS family permease
MVPAATLGLYGGAIGDALPRRVGLGLGYVVQTAICILVPLVFGTDLNGLLLLVFGVSVLDQFVGPGEKAVIPMVTKREQISTAASTISLADAIASGAATALLAPVLFKIWGADVLFYICGAFLAFAAIRVFALPLDSETTIRQALKRVNLTDPDLGFRNALRWLSGWPAISTMVMAGLVVSIIGKVTETFGPTYVEDVLGADPAFAVYVFAPAGLGAVVALGGAPWLIKKTSERWMAAVSILLLTLSLIALSFIDFLMPLFAPLSPLNVLKIFGIELSDDILAASFISLFVGFGSSLSSIAVQTYINRRAPQLHQGRIFGLQSILSNTAALLPVLFLGYMADLTSLEAVLLWAPIVIMFVIYGLLVLVDRFAGKETTRPGDVLASFWYEPEEEAVH